MQLVLDTNGITVKKKNNVFLVATKDQARMISPHKIDSIAVIGNILLSSAVIRMAALHRIPIFFFSAAAKVEAVVQNPYAGSISTIRKNQAFFCESLDGIHWVTELFELKRSHQVANLKYLQKRKTALSGKIGETIVAIEKIPLTLNEDNQKESGEIKNHLMGKEGAIARIYLQAVSKAMPPTFQFDKRSRQPGLDYYNATLNYLYGMLYSVIHDASLTAGLDPYFGIMHADQYNRPSFVYDLIEPFRPWVDRLLIDLCLYGQLDESHFIKQGSGFHLSKAGKSVVIPAFNDFLEDRRQFEQKRMTNKNHIHRYAGNFATYLKNYR
ncbi:MAG TPA: CRISPR-associated endonuclease Cas1 [Saprospiraceae bacterium]|nr:CRISPR-associated endonuclease Cas1 [Saprospiraceae bacterium]